MNPRLQLLRRLADLSEEDVWALLTVAERLRAKHLPPSSALAGQVSTEGSTPSVSSGGHPERFGVLRGSARSSGDVDAPPEEADQWTFDVKNLGV